MLIFIAVPVLPAGVPVRGRGDGGRRGRRAYSAGAVTRSNADPLQMIVSQVLLIRNSISFEQKIPVALGARVEKLGNSCNFDIV
ncbi:hypothetical protein [Janthinobacterium fluminis]|uniref:hypothetical protein n=1 Tax=Janthinobacterium fluminis TaxID=2987524 RepID=UPI0023583B1A|nr:hypothetical protein [Janthinobacterium fluminis]